jgi:hypothetical protein
MNFGSTEDNAFSYSFEGRILFEDTEYFSATSVVSYVIQPSVFSGQQDQIN